MSGRLLAQRRKGAKRCRVSNGLLCAFAPLREKILFDLEEIDSGGGSGDVDGGDRFERREINDFDRPRF